MSGVLEHKGAFVDATVLTGVRPGMRAYSEELFGPVAAVYRVANDDEAVELANVTSFGLGGTVLCSDLKRARSVADRIDSGMVWINQPTSSKADLPFGGESALWVDPAEVPADADVAGLGQALWSVDAHQRERTVRCIFRPCPAR
jgi:acyl-CoA reductase-like NAD-dependent aldehyde dehydrogenase